MIVTSAVCWLFIAIFFILYNIHYSSSVRMTYGLVYRPGPENAATGSTTAQASVQTNVIQPIAESSKVETNETKSSLHTKKLDKSTLTIIPKYRYIQNDTLLNKNVVDVHDRQSGSISANTQHQMTVTPNKYHKTTPTVPIQNSPQATPQVTVVMVTADAINKLQEVSQPVAYHEHQYQVREDSEAEGTSNIGLSEKAHKSGVERSHKNNAAQNKKYKKGMSVHHTKEKQNKKKGEFAENEHHADEHGNLKGGYQSQSHQEGGFEKKGHNSKKGSHGKKAVKKKHSKKKGYNDKYKMDKEHNVHEFWHDHKESGEFFVYGNKKKHKYDDKKVNKKGKKEKNIKKSKKKKKQKRRKKEKAGKVNSGYNT